MPVYTFTNIKTNEEYDLTMSYDELQEYLASNPKVNQIFQMNIVDPAGIGVSRPPADFTKYVLGKVKNVPGADHSKLEKRWTIPKEL